jgi:hypothetical protein
MANVSRPNGFRPVKSKSGAPYTGMANLYFIPSTDGTAVYIGDVVKLAGSADTAGTAPTVQLASAGDGVVGVVVGFLPNLADVSVVGTARAASTARYVWVADDPNLVFEAETSNGTPAAVDIGLNINHAVGTPDATMSRSGATIDVGSKGTTSNLTFKTLGFVARVDNEVGASAKMLVSINLHQHATGGGDDGGVQDGVIGV